LRSRSAFRCWRQQHRRREVTEIGDFIFRNSLTEAVVIPNTHEGRQGEYWGSKKWFFSTCNDDAFTKSGADVFRKVLQAEGIQILGEQTFAKAIVTSRRS